MKRLAWGCKVERVVSENEQRAPHGNCSLVLRCRVNCILDIPFCNQCFFVSWLQLEDIFGVMHRCLRVCNHAVWGFAGSVADASLPRRLGLGWSLGRSWSPSNPGSHMNHLFASKKLHINYLIGKDELTNSPNRFASMPWVGWKLWFHSDSTVKWCHRLFDPRSNYSWTLGCDCEVSVGTWWKFEIICLGPKWYCLYR